MLSVCTIYRQEDAGFIDGLINSLPPKVEINLMLTKPVKNLEVNSGSVVQLLEKNDYSKAESTLFELLTETNQVTKLESMMLDNGSILNMYLYEYVDGYFSFSSAKNACIEQAHQEWILQLDTDERIILEENELQILASLPQNVGGCMVRVESFQHGTAPNWKGTTTITPQCRIFRNIEGFTYGNICHEQITGTIQSMNYSIDLSLQSLMIKHVGYTVKNESDLDRVKEKHIRNISLMCKDVAHKNTMDWYVLERLASTLLSCESLGYFKRQVE